MLYFLFDEKTDELIEIVDAEKPKVRADSRDFKSRWDFNSFAMVNRIALQASKLTGRRHLPVDAGSHVSPRYDVVEAPTVGALVSKSFNGDTYPAGTITNISGSFRRIETSTGVVFWRRHNSAAWVANQTWSMVFGHRSEQNPSF